MMRNQMRNNVCGDSRNLSRNGNLHCFNSVYFQAIYHNHHSKAVYDLAGLLNQYHVDD